MSILIWSSSPLQNMVWRCTLPPVLLPSQPVDFWQICTSLFPGSPYFSFEALCHWGFVQSCFGRERMPSCSVLEKMCSPLPLAFSSPTPFLAFEVSIHEFWSQIGQGSIFVRELECLFAWLDWLMRLVFCFQPFCWFFWLAYFWPLNVLIYLFWGWRYTALILIAPLSLWGLYSNFKVWYQRLFLKLSKQFEAKGDELSWPYPLTWRQISQHDHVWILWRTFRRSKYSRTFL